MQQKVFINWFFLLLFSAFTFSFKLRSHYGHIESRTNPPPVFSPSRHIHPRCFAIPDKSPPFFFPSRTHPLPSVHCSSVICVAKINEGICLGWQKCCQERICPYTDYIWCTTFLKNTICIDNRSNVQLIEYIWSKSIKNATFGQKK